MIELDEERFRLTISFDEAIAFAIGMSDLRYQDPEDELRQLVGLVALDSLQYTEQWRAAGLVRACLKEKWPAIDW
jgi:hypothetical protein